jgi:hypothetical protein
MALLKQKTLPNSLIVDYWRIAQQNMNYDRLDCVVTLSSYASQEARNEGAEPAYSCTFDLSEYFHNKEGGEEVLKDLNRARAYEVIVELAQLEAEKEGGNSELAFFVDSEKA